LEIHERLNVVENWNSANGFVFFGKGGDLAANRIDEQDISVLRCTCCRRRWSM
jgi:TnpA family transposase